MKKSYKYYFIFLGCILILFLVLIAIRSNSTKEEYLQSSIEQSVSKAIETKKTETPNQTYDSSSNSSYSNVNFTNKFGTPSTICNHPGCTNTIAYSGDTNHCVVHSNKCAECGCYIDEDALFCIDCLLNAIEEIQNNN